MYQMMELTLSIDPRSEDDAQDLEQLTYQLREELEDLDVEAVDLIRVGEIPQRAKDGDPVAWGTLLVTLAASGGILATLINVIQSWITRHDNRGVTMEIDGDKLEVTGISSAGQCRLINEWINRHKER